MPVLPELTNGAHELVCGHAKEPCEGDCIFFSSSTTARFFSTRSSATETIHSPSIASKRTATSTEVLSETGSKPIKVWYPVIVAVLCQNRTVSSSENEEPSGLDLI